MSQDFRRAVLDIKRLASIINATFERYATHPVSKDLQAPPEKWLEPYKALAKECEILLDLPAAYKTLQDFVKTLPL